MALFDLKNIAKNMQKSADDIAKKVSDAAENLPESVKGVNAGDAVKDFSRRGKSAIDALVSKGEEVLADTLDKEAKTKEAVESALGKNAETAGVRILPVKDSLKLIYCMMAVDGSISPEEEEKFREIGISLDPDFESWQEELIEDISMKEAVLPDEEDYFDFIHDYAAEIIYSAEDTGEGLGVKTLVWDLLVMAFSEGDYSANERRLVRFVTKALKIDPAVPLEMEQALRTVTALDGEEEWLKSTDRPYGVIEEQINELRERRKTIIKGIHALMND